jgi:hypothetical protein
MTRQAIMPSSSEKCLRVSKTESYGLSRICFEMTRQATMTLGRWLWNLVCFVWSDQPTTTMRILSFRGFNWNPAEGADAAKWLKST